MEPALSRLFQDPFFRQFFGDALGSDRVPGERREQSLGSGIIVSHDGYILTNNHVVQGADEIKVALGDEKTVLDAKIVGTDPHTDVAVIKVEDQNLPAITLTNSDQLEVGDVVLAIGDPFGIVLALSGVEAIANATGIMRPPIVCAVRGRCPNSANRNKPRNAFITCK
jgi:S1-C subfamily serine protease